MRTAMTCLVILLGACGGGSGGVDRDPMNLVVESATSAGEARIAPMPGRRADFRISRSAAGFLVTRTSTGQGWMLDSDLLLQFDDMSVNLRMGAAASLLPTAQVDELIELYIAFFNRIPDALGLEYWIGQVYGGMPIDRVAEAFYSAAVAASGDTGYSASMSNSDFVSVIYKNVLGRQVPDPEGLAYWTNALDTGIATRGSLVGTMLKSAHSFKSDPAFGWVAALIDNKKEVGRWVSMWQGISYPSASESIQKGKALAAAVTANDVWAAIELVATPQVDFNLQSSSPVSTCVPTNPWVEPFDARVGEFAMMSSWWGVEAGLVSPSTAFHQCITAAPLPGTNSITSSWSWAYDGSTTGISGYPGVGFGRNPISAAAPGNSSSRPLDIRVDELGEFSMTYDVDVETNWYTHTFFDVWFTSGTDPQVLTHEVAISVRLPSYHEGDTLLGSVMLAGHKFDVWMHKGTGQGPDVYGIGVIPADTTSVLKGQIRLRDVTDFLVSKGVMSAQTRLQAVEFGTENFGGRGTVYLRRLSIAVQ